MNIVKVNASTQYDVKIGAGLLSTIGKEISNVINAEIITIISDSNVWPLYGKIVEESLEAAGFKVLFYIIPAGENSKSGATYLDVVNFLAENHISRSDCLIALGGGVVGDLTGFVAATYLRGIPYIQVPTTLLAAVDSSVGGKTAIDLECGKNLVGAFYQPKLVLFDCNVLDSLAPDVFVDGCAEVIKYGILYDAELFEHLMINGRAFDRCAVITRCVQLKQAVVAEDEYDTSSRMKLNLGHTIGHGVEAASHYCISHGKAVAIGISIVTRAAAKLGICSLDTAAQILRALQQFGLPTETVYPAPALFEAALSDKKRNGDTVNLIIPEAIGRCGIHPTSIDDLKAFIEAGLSYGYYDLSSKT